MAYLNREELKDKIAEQLAHHLWHFGAKATNATAIAAGAYGTNKVVNYATGRKKNWVAYLNPLEYARSAVQIPLSLFVAKKVEEQASDLLQQLGNRLEKVEPVAEQFMQPIIRAAISPIIDALEAQGLVKLPEPTVLQQATAAAKDVVRVPFSALGDIISWPFGVISNWKETITNATDPWKQAEVQAHLYGEEVVKLTGEAVERARKIGSLPNQFMGMMTENTGLSPVAIYGAAAAVSLLTYFGSRSICNKIAMRVSQTTNVNASGNVMNVVLVPSVANVAAPAPEKKTPTP